MSEYLKDWNELCFESYDAHVEAFYRYWYTCDKCGSLDDFYGTTCDCYGKLEITYE